jgi:hypothetical protein
MNALLKCIRSSLAGPRAPVNRAFSSKGSARFVLDQHLRLQASLDGELSDWRNQKPVEKVTKDSEARSLLDELSLVTSALAAGEPERRVPQRRERYWKAIERAINSQELGDAGAVLPGHRRSREGIERANACSRGERS